MHQIRFRLGLRPIHPAGGAYSALQAPSLGIKGSLLRDGKGKGGSGGRRGPFYFLLRMYDYACKYSSRVTWPAAIRSAQCQ